MTERPESNGGTGAASCGAVASPLSRFQSGSFTGIGSLPHRDAVAAAEFSLGEHAIPVVPSLPKRSPAESLVAQAVTGLAGVTLGQYGSIAVDVARLDPGAPVVTDLRSDAFVGFRTFLDCAVAAGHTGPLKWQFVGPLTLGAALERAGAPAEVAYELARVAIRSHLRVLAHAIAEKLPDSAQLMLLDEPLLADVLARDFPIAPDDAVDLVSSTMAALCPDVAVGVHCCAPADWASILATGPQVLSMPATSGLVSVAGYLDRFLRNGGWGRVGRRGHRGSDRCHGEPCLGTAQHVVV